MAGNNCKWCNRPSKRKYCYRHIQLGRVLDDINEQIIIIDKMRPSKNLRTVRANLVATRLSICDELERS